MRLHWLGTIQRYHLLYVTTYHKYIAISQYPQTFLFFAILRNSKHNFHQKNDKKKKKGERKQKKIDEDPLYLWLDFKFWGHIGFVLEALLESFPQSILQMVAMVYFQNMSFAFFCVYAHTTKKTTKKKHKKQKN